MMSYDLYLLEVLDTTESLREEIKYLIVMILLQIRREDLLIVTS